MKAIIVNTTCANKLEAKNIAKILIKKGLAACAQMSNINSFFKWKGKLCDDREVLLSIKTKKKHYGKIKSKIKELHSYDVPEIIAIDIKKMSKEYKKFIRESC